jgi:hypothetical protein
MNHPGSVAVGTGCICGHIFWRPHPHPDHPRSVRKASALASVRTYLGHASRLPGIAIYQAVTENA